MPTRPPTHRPSAPHSKQHRPKEADRQARRALATNSAAWRAIRKWQLAREPLCRHCAAKGITRHANQVDHIDGDAMHDEPSNWQSLCSPCHSRKTAVENGAFGKWTMQPAWLPTTRKPLIVVCGPPAAGKTTHVGKHARAGELVLDLDEIAVEMGAQRRSASLAEVGKAVAERNERLGAYMRGQTTHPRCWLIVTAGSLKARRFWEERGCDVLILNPGKAECKQRIRDDVRRPHAIKERQCAAVDRWS